MILSIQYRHVLKNPLGALKVLRQCSPCACMSTSTAYPMDHCSANKSSRCNSNDYALRVTLIRFHSWANGNNLSLDFETRKLYLPQEAKRRIANRSVADQLFPSSNRLNSVQSIRCIGLVQSGLLIVPSFSLLHAQSRSYVHAAL